MKGNRVSSRLEPSGAILDRSALQLAEQDGEAPSGAAAALAIVLNLVIPLGAAFVAPALPHLLQEFQAGGSSATWFVGVYTVAALAATFPLGILADLLGRSKVLVAALALFGAGGLLCGLTPSFTALLVGRALQGLALGPLVAMSLVLATESAPQGQQLRLHGWRSVAAAVAEFLLPPLGAALVAASWRVPFVVLALTWVMIPWSLRAIGHERLPRQATAVAYPQLLKASLTNPAVLIVLLVGLIRFMLKYTITFGLPLLLAQRTDGGPALAGILLGSVNALASLVAISTPRVATRIAPWRLMGLGCVLLGSVPPCMLLAASLPQLLAVLTTYAVGDGLLATTQSFFVTSLAPKTARVGFVSLGSLFRNSGKALSSVLLAIVVNGVAGPAAWGVGAGIAFLGALSWRFSPDFSLTDQEVNPSSTRGVG